MFNLSFESLTSREALHALRDVQKNDIKTWERIKTAQYRVEIHQADEEAEPPFAHAVDAVLQHIASGKLSVPHGYGADELGNLLAHNESESYERVLDDAVEPQVSVVEEVEILGEGRGKRRRIANTQYNDFWQH